MVIANFTPDSIKWKHAGRSGTLKTGDIKEFETGRGNHILNKWGPRGLVVMQFGDDEETKKQEALEIYKDFWIRQITVFNRHNETLRNENKAYVFPPKDYQTKAKELGIELIGPWALNAPVSDEKVAAVEKENIALKGQVNDLTEKVGTLTDQIETLIETFTQPDEGKGKNKKGK